MDQIYVNSRQAVAVKGLIAGVITFLLASILMPQSFKSVEEHDHLLAARVGLIYTTFAVCWLSEYPATKLKSLGRRFVIGLSLGSVYALLSEMCRDFGIIMIVLPSCISAALYMLTNALGAAEHSKTRYLRFCSDGMIAGFILVSTHAALLLLGLFYCCYTGFIYLQDFSVTRYVQAMSVIGTCSFGLASCLFFLFMIRLRNESARPFESKVSRELVRVIAVLLVVICVANGNKLWKLIVGLFLQN